MGTRALALDLGMNVELEILTDATAAIGICQRRGLSKIRHLAVADLWVQERLKAKDFALTKTPGRDNPSDILTKHVESSLLKKHLQFLCLEFQTGRSDAAPSLTHAVIVLENESFDNFPVFRKPSKLTRSS